MPGLRFKLWPVFSTSKHPWVQVPAGEIGVIISQVGAPLEVGAKSAVYNEALANFSDVRELHRQRRPEGRATSGAPSRHAAAAAPRGIHGAHPAAGSPACRPSPSC